MAFIKKILDKIVPSDDEESSSEETQEKLLTGQSSNVCTSRVPNANARKRKQTEEIPKPNTKPKLEKDKKPDIPDEDAGKPGAKTWLEIIKDPNSTQDTKQLAINSIDNEMAYSTKIMFYLQLYLESKNVKFKTPKEHTWKYFIDNVYGDMLKKRRKTTQEITKNLYS